MGRENTPTQHTPTPTQDTPTEEGLLHSWDSLFLHTILKFLYVSFISFLLTQLLPRPCYCRSIHYISPDSSPALCSAGPCSYLVGCSPSQRTAPRRNHQNPFEELRVVIGSSLTLLFWADRWLLDPPGNLSLLHHLRTY